MSDYIVKNALFAREDANGDIVANPKVLQICVNEFGVKQDTTYTDKECLLKDGVTEVEGETKVTGGFKYPLESNTIGFTLTHLLGDASGAVDATVATWGSDTVMAIGDKVNTSDGKWTLTVKRVSGDAKTGGIEPTVTSYGETISDNNVVWSAIPKERVLVYPYSSIVPKFTAELTLEDGDGNTWIKQYRHLELDKFPITINGNGDYEVSVDTIGGVAVDETSPLWGKDLLSNTGAMLVKAEESFLGGSCELTNVLIDDIAKALDSIELTIDKGLTEQPTVSCKKRISRKLSIKGKASLLFTPADYENFKNREAFDFKATISSREGTSILWHFPKCKPKFTEPNIKTHTEVTLDPDFTVNVKDDATPICTATATIPSLVNGADGSIIGDW